MPTYALHEHLYSGMPELRFFTRIRQIINDVSSQGEHEHHGRLVQCRRQRTFSSFEKGLFSIKMLFRPFNTSDLIGLTGQGSKILAPHDKSNGIFAISFPFIQGKVIPRGSDVIVLQFSNHLTIRHLA